MKYLLVTEDDHGGRNEVVVDSYKAGLAAIDEGRKLHGMTFDGYVEEDGVFYFDLSIGEENFYASMFPI
jgi:hypothetical protein